MPHLVPRLAAVPSFLSILVLELQALDTMSAAADPFVCLTAKSPERKSEVLLTRSWFMPGASIATHCHVHAIYATRCEDECNCNPGTNLDVSHRACQNGVKNRWWDRAGGKRPHLDLGKFPALSPMPVGCWLYLWSWES